MSCMCDITTIQRHTEHYTATAKTPQPNRSRKGTCATTTLPTPTTCVRSGAFATNDALQRGARLRRGNARKALRAFTSAREPILHDTSLSHVRAQAPRWCDGNHSKVSREHGCESASSFDPTPRLPSRTRRSCAITATPPIQRRGGEARPNAPQQTKENLCT